MYVLVTDENLERTLSYLEGFDELSIDLETSSLNYLKGIIVGVSISNGERTYYFPTHHNKYSIDPIYFYDWLEVNENKKWDTHGGWFDWKYLKFQEQIDLNIVNDTMVMAHLLDTNRSRHHGKGLKLKRLMKTILKWKEAPEYKELFGKIPLNEFEPKAVLDYACRDAEATYKLKEIFEKPILEKYKGLYDLEMKLLKVTARMEMRGIQIDLPKLNKIYGECKALIPKLEKDLYEKFELKFNLNSDQQLAGALLKLGVPLFEKTDKNKQYKVGEKILEPFAKKYPIIKDVLNHRKTCKMTNTFLAGLIEGTDPKTSRLHGDFLQVHVCSGRYASANPNLQNIPVTENAINNINIREVIIPAPGYGLASIDYSQIEVWILLALAKSKIRETLKPGQKIDVHTWMASRKFHKPEKDILKQERYACKKTTFGLNYGMTKYGLAYQLGISVEEAEDFMTEYFTTFPEVKAFIENVHDYVERWYCVSTYHGRKRNFPELRSSERKIKAYGYRGAVNHIIQGTAADILKIAMVKVQKHIDKTYGDDVRMIFTVHDELVFEISEEMNFKVVIDTLRGIMTTQIEGIPLTVEAETGPNWGNLGEIK